MFTGIIKKVGKVTNVVELEKASRLTISQKEIINDLHLGDSVAINGVCLTVVELHDESFEVDLMKETLDLTTFSKVSKDSLVNLEPALRLNDAIGGHLLLGHVDGIGEIIDIKQEGNSKVYSFKTTKSILDLISYKACIAIDGVSLTVSAITDKYFEVSLIPYTLSETILGLKQIGDFVNLENDYFARYIFKWLNNQKDGDK